MRSSATRAFLWLLFVPIRNDGMNKLKVTALVLLVAALGLACGEDETPDATDEETSGERLLIEVEAQDFRFIPASFTAEAGTTIELIFENTG